MGQAEKTCQSVAIKAAQFTFTQSKRNCALANAGQAKSDPTRTLDMQRFKASCKAQSPNKGDRRIKP